jgi:hypothetical protein
MNKSLQHFVTQCNIISMKLVLLIMLQDSEGLWKQNEVSEQDVTKFKGNNPIVFFLCELKTWTKDAFQKLKPKHPKCSAFTFINVVTPL